MACQVRVWQGLILSINLRMKKKNKLEWFILKIVLIRHCKALTITFPGSSFLTTNSRPYIKSVKSRLWKSLLWQLASEIVILNGVTPVRLTLVLTNEYEQLSLKSKWRPSKVVKCSPVIRVQFLGSSGWHSLLCCSCLQTIPLGHWAGRQCISPVAGPHMQIWPQSSGDQNVELRFWYLPLESVQPHWCGRTQPIWLVMKPGLQKQPWKQALLQKVAFNSQDGGQAEPQVL